MGWSHAELASLSGQLLKFSGKDCNHSPRQFELGVAIEQILRHLDIADCYSVALLSTDTGLENLSDLVCGRRLPAVLIELNLMHGVLPVASALFPSPLAGRQSHCFCGLLVDLGHDVFDDSYGLDNVVHCDVPHFVYGIVTEKPNLVKGRSLLTTDLAVLGKTVNSALEIVASQRLLCSVCARRSVSFK